MSDLVLENLQATLVCLGDGGKSFLCYVRASIADCQLQVVFTVLS